jgi:hypothetical protein
MYIFQLNQCCCRRFANSCASFVDINSCVLFVQHAQQARYNYTFKDNEGMSIG